MREIIEIAGRVLLQLIVLDWLCALAAIIGALYFGLKMSEDLKPSIRASFGIPLFVADDELESDEGRQARGRFHRSLALFLILIISMVPLIYLYHAKWR